MIVLGVDPDLHSTALALADEHRVYAVELVQVDKKLKGEDAVIAMCEGVFVRIEDFLNANAEHTLASDELGAVVEAQQLYLGGSKSKATPEDLLNLANVTGAALAAVTIRGLRAARPLPKKWKGDVPKEIHQARVCLRYGWTFDSKSDHVEPFFAPGSAQWLTKPDGADTIKPLSNWKHVLDAVGLAYYGATKGFGNG